MLKICFAIHQVVCGPGRVMLASYQDAGPRRMSWAVSAPGEMMLQQDSGGETGPEGMSLSVSELQDVVAHYNINLV